MRFYLGTHEVSWLGKNCRAPLYQPQTPGIAEETREAGLREAISATLRQAIKSSDKPESSNG